ncbi:S8 family serine peptidase [Filomicrobium sp.]|uniref:S8 family peptidase n=1 Tax=Filomicrobium sp. TaxID=2024831 RepID=UPI00258E62A2|nr:S8 family serine peptidase [Filomicrobium sp.]MCV0370495.1 S8 family serine peptidase [Filomicrobium sp.]
MPGPNFLLGKAERLVTDISGTSGPPNKEHPYSFVEAQARLSPMLGNVSRKLDNLPDDACPNDQAVVSLILNPEYIAKSYFPKELFRLTNLQPVGSRPKRITPEKKSKNRLPEETITTEYFVMGRRDDFRHWAQSINRWTENTRGAVDIRTIETIDAADVEDKLKGPIPKGGEVVFEVVLHTDELIGEAQLLPTFRDYLDGYGIKTDLGNRFYAGGLCFVEIKAPAEKSKDIAIFTPVRALRQMPELRMLRPTIRSAVMPSQSVTLPDADPIDPTVRAAIFDGGLPEDHPLTRWVTPIDALDVGDSSSELLDHGVAVTSAYLFGSIDPSTPIPVPFAPADHYRVLDTAPGQNSHELYDVLHRIDDVLSSRHYEFVNLSLGPRLPIEDDEVHAWTAVLDDRLSNGHTLATVAVGNDGEGDASLGFNRIQVPSDCVNAVAVGACDSPDADWKRAPYSSVGPGRSPGLIKPDLVAFGGAINRPFIVIANSDTPQLDAIGGTSFSAPSALRMGAGVRSHFGSDLEPLAIRALLTHCAESSEHSIDQVGRGRLAKQLQDIVLTDDDTIRVVYQGEITPARYVRAPIPVPGGSLSGKVRVTATLCYATSTDPHHPGNYTRAGLEPVFRPNENKRKKPEQVHADTQSFFGKGKGGLSEAELRHDAWKWENCLHSSLRFLGSSLVNPVFDIHYNARLEGRDFRPEDKLAYALVVTVRAKRIPDLYDQIVRRYANQLEPLKPRVDLPITNTP